MGKITIEVIEKLGLKFRDNKKQYGWFLEVSKNRVLTWCHGGCISLDFDTEDYDYNNTLYDFDIETIEDINNILSLFIKNETSK